MVTYAIALTRTIGGNLVTDGRQLKIGLKVETDDARTRTRPAVLGITDQCFRLTVTIHKRSLTCLEKFLAYFSFSKLGSVWI